MHTRLQSHKKWMMRVALDRTLDKLGEHAKLNVILDLERIGVYDQQAEFLDAPKVFGALSDRIGVEASTMLFESTLLEMDKIKTVSKLD